MQEVGDILRLYSRNFIFQIEKVFNTQFQLMNLKEEDKEGGLGGEEGDETKKPLQISFKID
jgi:hypothetical protein